VRAKLGEYVAGGVKTPVIALVPAPGTDLAAAARALAPSGGDSWK
jgi:hypothetical protein